MPTRPTSPDPSGDASRVNPFAGLSGGLGAGLDFFQDWLKAAGSALPNLQGSAASAGMGSWAMPTLDPDELDKRIQDLKTVQFWLEQNARMIAMTIQGLEVQKMTLSTLKGMNVSMDSLRDALKARNATTDTPASAPRAEPPAAASRAQEAAPAPGSAASEPRDTMGSAMESAMESGAELINPMRWWDTLTEQFTHLASQASQTAQSVGTSMSDLLAQAQQAQHAHAGAPAEAEATPAPTGRKPSARASGTRSRAGTTGTSRRTATAASGPKAKG
ncbi:MAG: hypothetical protein IIA02_03135 [Proteobacteria bacterium]|uniref:PhaM family polyhydroxyalkanoate granule multifunctional regulatory protein n=1 Tax=Aquabacterium sp. TaxID=1872578 RepID=UPI0035C703E7|nr:hypothetical protein [Pseudomonadota bacterium]